jgi:hypothetical protein
MAEFHLQGNSALLMTGAKETYGLEYEQLRQRAQSADLMINISGMLAHEELVARVPVRVYLDLDPAFNQLWSAVQGIDMRFAAHTHFVTVGNNVGAADCPVPACGLSWLKTFQPIVLEHWPMAKRITHDGLTTIANWRGYGSIEHEGRHYGQKAHSWRQLMNLPSLTDEQFLVALSIHPDETKDLAALSTNGWRLLNPAHVTGSPGAYQQFIQGSKAELGIAKSGYVVSNCGWFSDRSVCYLASGRPVIAQETGFSRHLPTGVGLFCFQNADDVIAAIQQVKGDYPKHAQQARAIAEECFDSRKVLTRFLEQVNV